MSLNTQIGSWRRFRIAKGATAITRFEDEAGNVRGFCGTGREPLYHIIILRKILVGTELNVVQEGIPDVIPVEMCYLGWQQSLDNLAQLVEPDINQ